MSTARRLFLIVIGFAICAALAITGVVYFLRDDKHQRDITPVADYGSYYFIGVRTADGQVFEEVVPHSAANAQNRGSLYIQTPDGHVFPFWQLPEDAVRSVAGMTVHGTNERRYEGEGWMAPSLEA